MRAHIPIVDAGYVLQAGGANLSSVGDSTAYYFGSLPGQPPQFTPGLNRLYIPKAGMIKKVYGYFTAGANGGDEPQSVCLRLNDDLDILIVNDLAIRSGSNPFKNVELNIPVNEGDFFEIKWVTPVWANNPSSVRTHALVYIE